VCSRMGLAPPSSPLLSPLPSLPKATLAPAALSLQPIVRTSARTKKPNAPVPPVADQHTLLLCGKQPRERETLAQKERGESPPPSNVSLLSRPPSRFSPPSDLRSGGARGLPCTLTSRARAHELGIGRSAPPDRTRWRAQQREGSAASSVAPPLSLSNSPLPARAPNTPPPPCSPCPIPTGPRPGLISDLGRPRARAQRHRAGTKATAAGRRAAASPPSCARVLTLRASVRAHKPA
jgi:hypothetical protein